MNHEKGSAALAAPPAARRSRRPGRGRGDGSGRTVPRGRSGTGGARRTRRPGPGARTRQKPSTFRLRPMTGSGPVRRTPVRTAARREPILRMPGRGRSMVLTFDDGPDPRYTPGIPRTLREYDVRAMFFVCGEMAADHKDLLREMADDGHIVGNHTWTHPLLTRLTRPGIRSDRRCATICRSCWAPATTSPCRGGGRPEHPAGHVRRSRPAPLSARRPSGRTPPRSPRSSRRRTLPRR